jgi:segregation and condensation protein A
METQTQTASTPAFLVRAGNYEGPLELLLDLIEKRKLLVNEVSLSQVTDDFILHVKSATVFPMDMAADFISVAATLLLIKSRSLLPNLELSQEEEIDVRDLEARLALYEKVRTASRELSKIFGQSYLHPAGARAPEVFFAPGPRLQVALLEQAVRNALTTAEVETKLPEVRIRPLISIEEMMDTLRVRVERAMSVSFSEFRGSSVEKVEVIVSFLALLELVKQGSVDASQAGAFHDIQISSLQTGMPRY